MTEFVSHIEGLRAHHIWGLRSGLPILNEVFMNLQHVRLSSTTVERARSRVCVFSLGSCSQLIQSQYDSSGLSWCRQRFSFSITYRIVVILRVKAGKGCIPWNNDAKRNCKISYTQHLIECGRNDSHRSTTLIVLQSLVATRKALHDTWCHMTSHSDHSN